MQLCMDAALFSGTLPGEKYTAGQLSCLRTAARRAYDHSRACGFWNQCCWTWSAVRQDMNCKSHPRVIWRTVTFAFAVLAYSSRKPIRDKNKTKQNKKRNIYMKHMHFSWSQQLPVLSQALQEFFFIDFFLSSLKAWIHYTAFTIWTDF